MIEYLFLAVHDVQVCISTLFFPVLAYNYIQDCLFFTSAIPIRRLYQPSQNYIEDIIIYVAYVM